MKSPDQPDQFLPVSCMTTAKIRVLLSPLRANSLLESAPKAPRRAIGIALSFHREMADAPREFVGPDVAAAVTFESYPRFIKGGFQDYEGLGIKRPAANSKHVSLTTIEVARKQRLLNTPPETSRIFGANFFRPDAPERRGLAFQSRR